MKKCKCLKNIEDNSISIEFREGKLYKYEFLPAAGLNSPFFRVFENNGKFSNFEFKKFMQHFER